MSGMTAQQTAGNLPEGRVAEQAQGQIPRQLLNKLAQRPVPGQGDFSRRKVIEILLSSYMR